MNSSPFPRPIALWYVLLACFVVGEPSLSRGQGKPPLFRDEVQPILTRCVRCHHPDGPAGGLDLTTRMAALKGGESGAALVPGSARDSRLFRLVSERKMPPKKPLNDDEVAVLRRWLDAGATWEGVVEGQREAVRAGPDWWSLQAVARPRLPAVRDLNWPANPIDAFLLAALEAHGLRPAPPADRSTLIRRVTFDLLGLPPTPAEIDAFVGDRSPGAYERLIDRLLASPHYGERWGRHWLDIARFGESQGYERDKLRDHSWRYRDYVIRSFNEDKPYPQFVREQLAGDVLEPGTADGVVATGFLVAGPWDEVGNGQQSAVMRARVREEELEDLLGTVGQSFLGLTINCARCHDHKFDPIPQRDYYRIKAVFDGIRHGDRPAASAEQIRAREDTITQLNREIAETESRLSALESAARAKVLAQRPTTSATGLPGPLARWSFARDARDEIGGLHGELIGGAEVRDGRLRLAGKSAFVRTAPLERNLSEKTLEGWVRLTNLDQRGGAVLTVETKEGRVFDAIVFGERQPKKWSVGSDFFYRTRDLAGAAESDAGKDMVHVAVVYRDDNSIAFYRNGVPYGEPYIPSGVSATLRTYKAGEARVLFGLRHTGAGNGYLNGEIEEARLYGRALSVDEVAASYRAGPERVTEAEMLAAMTLAEQQTYRDVRQQWQARRSALKQVPPLPLAYAATIRQPEPTHVLQRGDVEKPAEQVAAGGLSAVKTPVGEFGLAPDAPESQRRRQFAEWVANPANPLTARVLVNRIWHYHFGRGLVGTPSDFGFNGERPTHPELLDWLASEFLVQGGSVKAMHRLILTSQTYRQSARFDPKAAEIDADNRLLWRFAPRRLEGEAVRDAMLSVSGQLNPQLGGPSFRPFEVVVFNSHFYRLGDPIGPEFNRRTVYRINVNSAKEPLLESFDCPDPSTKMPRRSITTTPLQALSLMNGSFVQRQSRSFAERVREAAGSDAGAQLEHAYRLALGRTPDTGERQRASAVVREQGLETLCWAILNASEFLYLR